MHALTWWLILAATLTAHAADVPAKEKPAAADKPPFTFVMIEYDGGSWSELARGEMIEHADIYIPNMLRWMNTNKLSPVSEKVERLRFSDDRIFNHPALYIAGHFRFKMTDPDKKNLKSHLERGGMLYIEDCGGAVEAIEQYGAFAKQIYDLLPELFPGEKWERIPFDHEIFRKPYVFEEGLPNFFGDNNNGAFDPKKPRKGQGGMGFMHKGRMISFYSDADTCCAWGPAVGKEWEDQPWKMGANIITYLINHSAAPGK